MKTKLKDMTGLLTHEIRDLLSAERQLTTALPKLIKHVTDEQLKEAIEEHLRETEEHVARLERVCELLDIPVRAEKCQAMNGLIKETAEVMTSRDTDAAVLDAAIIAAAQRVEHYEIAAYGCAKAFAQQLGMNEVVDLLDQTLQEEKAADEKLNEIAASSVNPHALQASASD